MSRVVVLLALVLVAARPAVAQVSGGDRLVMFEEKSCSYCVVWDRRVGTIYAKTDEARKLPLRRVELNVSRPADLRSIKNVHVAPTFVVMHCGREFQRITGYIGEDQFWGLLDAALHSLEAGTAQTRSPKRSSGCKA